MNWVAIDFETANTSRDSACALGAAVVENGRITRTASWLIRPPTLEFNPYNVAVHGLTADDVRNSPAFDAVWAELEPMLAGGPVIAHNASFDLSVLRSSLDACGVEYPTLEYYCTCNLCRAVWPDFGDHKLDSMARRLGFDLNHHEAESDAVACAEIALACCRQTGATSLAALAGEHAVTAGRLRPGGYTPCRFRRKNKKSR